MPSGGGHFVPLTTQGGRGESIKQTDGSVYAAHVLCHTHMHTSNQSMIECVRENQAHACACMCYATHTSNQSVFTITQLQTHYAEIILHYIAEVIGYR